MSYTQGTFEVDIRKYSGLVDTGTIGNKPILTLPNRAGWGFITNSIVSWLANNSTWIVSPVFTVGTNAPDFNNLLAASPQLGTDPTKYRPSTPLAPGPPTANQPIILTPGATLQALVSTAGSVSVGTPFVRITIFGIWIELP